MRQLLISTVGGFNVVSDDCMHIKHWSKLVCVYWTDLGVLLVCPVLQPKLQQGVIHPLRRTGVHLNHVFQESFQLSRVVGKYWDEFLRIGL